MTEPHHDAPHPEWPEPDTSPNEAKDGKPPATWDPGKVTQPQQKTKGNDIR